MNRSIILAAALLASGAQASAQATPPGKASAVFAGGCFWCTESDFDKVPGVIATTSGYIGGKAASANYEQVSAGGSGHIEAVRVVYDPARVSYASLAARFIRTIDPTDGGGQFCDRGSQYRSAFFVANPAERNIAESVKTSAAARLNKPVATLVLPATPFYAAETYHQDYYKKNPVRYRFYRTSCGRDARLKRIWGAKG
ncbi:MAG TPA: peptide-methionine (S)-S-oxide reductase MsrA [Sphingomicrobium sp.]|nr:peptide-methionine (S)-S-oxide reductase MsrA [Sphingomicrobium sp.]